MTGLQRDKVMYGIHTLRPKDLLIVKYSYPLQRPDRCAGVDDCQYYLFTWKRVSPSLKKALICLMAAMPALMLASAVCAPIFLGVEK